MELQLVTFEQATALKELGFPQETDSWNYYDIEGNCVPYLQKGGHKEYCCDAPTLELVAKWLRKEKNIIIEITLDLGGDYVVHYCKSPHFNTLFDNYVGYYEDYEEAEEFLKDYKFNHTKFPTKEWVYLWKRIKKQNSH